MIFGGFFSDEVWILGRSLEERNIAVSECFPHAIQNQGIIEKPMLEN